MLRAVLLLVCLAAPAMLAAPASARSGETVERLRPGQFFWLEPEGPMPVSTGLGVTLTVSIPDQRAYVYRDGALIGVSTVSTGKAGKETPTGEYTILQKKVFHRSNLYSNAPMPFMQRLTWDGIALHAGQLPGYPASHGCIRFPAAFAKQLYALTELGGMVSVVDYPVFEPIEIPARPVQVADVATPRRVVTLAAAPPPLPTIEADTAGLGGEAFNLVTMGPGTAPPSLIEAVQREPASWVAGPGREIVQPLPAGYR